MARRSLGRPKCLQASRNECDYKNCCPNIGFITNKSDSTKQNHKKIDFSGTYFDPVRDKIISQLGTIKNDCSDYSSKIMLESTSIPSTYSSRNNFNNFSKTNVSPLTLKSVRRNIKKDKIISSIYKPIHNLIPVLIIINIGN